MSAVHQILPLAHVTQFYLNPDLQRCTIEFLDLECSRQLNFESLLAFITVFKVYPASSIA